MAAATLWTMAYDSSDNKDAIREAGGVNMLVHLLEVRTKYDLACPPLPAPCPL